MGRGGRKWGAAHGALGKLRAVVGVGATAPNRWGSGIYGWGPGHRATRRDPQGRVPAGGAWVPGSPGTGTRGTRISGANLGSERTQAPESRRRPAPAAAATGHPPGATSPALAGAEAGSERPVYERRLLSPAAAGEAADLAVAAPRPRPTSFPFPAPATAPPHRSPALSLDPAPP